MGYYLADATGPLADFASIGGYAEFRAWALNNRGAIRAFVQRGFSEDLKQLADELSQTGAPSSVADQRDILMRCAKRAVDVLIVTDGMSEPAETLRAAETSQLVAQAYKEIPKFKTAVLHAFAAARRTVDKDRLRSATTKEEALACFSKVEDTITTQLSKFYVPYLLNAMQRGGDVGLEKVRAFRTAEGLRTLDTEDDVEELTTGVSFNRADPNAVAWAKKNAAKHIDSISQTTKDRINDSIVAALEDGDVSDAYAVILAAVGDDVRAENIARTEVMSAANEGQRQSWDQAVEKGWLTGEEKRTWIANDSACLACLEYADTTCDLDGTYADGVDGPPLHNQCECTEGLVA